MTDTKNTIEQQLVWQGISVTITYEPQWLSFGVAHIQLRAGERLPVTETGYRSIFTSEQAVSQAGGLEFFVVGLLDDAAKSQAWKGYKQERKQLSLF